ncbi:copper resistance CopC family protein [Microbacterium sp. 18062]|uniref:copper resistance CopC family protein n=1 Tax=Microbacterium sp. 18062 TaxID=2681410 RepID=UPI0013575A86|nr:copper resistance CopC family protein [Microbacterium sp. 18062]
MIAFGSPTRSRRALIAALAGFALALSAVLVTAAPASAHDELVSTDPAAGTAVDALPDAITLTYSADLLSDGSSTVVQVTDGAGTSLTDGDPVVTGNVVTQALEGEPSGTVSVAWRVVSSDGHPIAGELAFEVAGAPSPTAQPTPTESASTPATDTASPDAMATATATPEDGDGANPLPWIVGAAALLIVIALVVWLLGARARQQKEIVRDRTAGRDDVGER